MRETATPAAAVTAPPIPTAPITISTFDRLTSSKPTPYTEPLADFVAGFAVPVITEDKQGIGCWSPALWPGGAHSRRGDKVLCVGAFVVDIDALPADLLPRLAALGILAVWHTTHSSRPGELRGRLIIPKDLPHSPRLHTAYLRALCALLGIPWDAGPSGAADPGRVYFPPSSPRAEWYEHRVFPGRVLTLAELDLGGEAQTTFTRADLEALAKGRKGSARDREAIAWLAKGEAFAGVGDRDNTAFRVAGLIARAYPSATTASVLAIVRRSLEITGAPDEQKFASMLERHGAMRQEQEREELAARAQRIRSAFAATCPERDWGYQPDEHEDLAASVGCGVGELRQRWIVRYGGNVWLLSPGGYVGPYDVSSATTAALVVLAPAGLDLERRGDDGRTVPRPWLSTEADYGVVARDVVYDLTTERTTFDAPTGTLRIGLPRLVGARYHEHVETWLGLLFGAEYTGPAPRALLWFCLFPCLDRPLAFLGVYGPKGCGKSLLLVGLARIWTRDAPTTIEQAFGPWTDRIRECPVIGGDETGVPSGQTERFRALLSAREHTVSRKYAHNMKVVGNLRMVATKNEGDQFIDLEREKSLTTADIDALADRHVRIDVTPGAAAAQAYLETLTDEQRASMAEREIAEHVLWISEQPAPMAEVGRFALRDVEYAERASVSVDARASVLEVLVRALARGDKRVLSEPQRDYPHPKPGQAACPESIFVVGRDVREMLREAQEGPVPTMPALARTLRDLGSEGRFGRTSGQAAILAALRIPATEAGIRGFWLHDRLLWAYCKATNQDVEIWQRAKKSR